MICWCTIHYHQPGLLQISKNLQIPFITTKISSIIMGQKKANIFVVLHSVIDVGRDITPSGNSCVQIVQWHRYKVHAYVRTTATSNCDANSFRFCFFLAKMLRVTNCRLRLGLKYPEGVGTEVTNGQRLASVPISTSWKSLAMCFCCPS